MVKVGDKRFKRGNRKKRNIRETNGENGHGLLHLSKAAVCGRHRFQTRARQNLWGNASQDLTAAVLCCFHGRLEGKRLIEKWISLF